MYMHTLARFCESRRRFSLFSPLNIYISLFFVLSLLPACCRVPLLHSPGAWPSVSLSPPSLPAFPPLVLRSCCRVSDPAVCCLCAVSCGDLGGLPSCLLCLVVLWWLPSLVRHQAQDSVTVWADAARICPRPCLLLPMCCRVFRWLSRGFRPSVRVCVLLPCVVWW